MPVFHHPSFAEFNRGTQKAIQANAIHQAYERPAVVCGVPVPGDRTCTRRVKHVTGRCPWHRPQPKP